MNKRQKCPWCDGDNTRAEYDAVEGLWWQQHDCSDCGFKHEERVYQLTPADDLAYIKANTPSSTNVEYVNTGIDIHGRWFTRTSRDAAAVAMTDYYTTVKDFVDKMEPLPITGYWVNERSDCFIICGPEGTIPGKYDTAKDAMQVCELLNK